MLVKPPLEALLPRVENRYTLAIAVAKRTRQLVSGAQPMAEADSPNLVTLACEELAADQIVAVPETVEPVVPLRPDVEAELHAARKAQEEEMELLTAETGSSSLNVLEQSQSLADAMAAVALELGTGEGSKELGGSAEEEEL